jgi:hypothetical protein
MKLRTVEDCPDVFKGKLYVTEKLSGPDLIMSFGGRGGGSIIYDSERIGLAFKDDELDCVRAVHKDYNDRYGEKISGLIASCKFYSEPLGGYSRVPFNHTILWRLQRKGEYINYMQESREWGRRFNIESLSPIWRGYATHDVFFDIILPDIPVAESRLGGKPIENLLVWNFDRNDEEGKPLVVEIPLGNKD